MFKRIKDVRSLLLVAAVLGAAPVLAEEDPIAGPSEVVSWVCTGAYCPWGSQLEGHALPWPTSASPTNLRFGYTTSANVYLPASAANRTVVWVDSGTATLYAGQIDEASHRTLATLSAGQFYSVSGLAPGEFMSVQGDGPFTYQIDIAPEGPSEPVPEVPPPGSPSQFVTWTCAGSPCPWGATTDGAAVVWPNWAEPLSTRFGYTTSKPVYLPANRANATTIDVLSGTVSLYAGHPNAASHRLLTTIAAGSSYGVSGLAADEVLSVQSDSPFTFDADIPATPLPGEEPPEEPQEPEEPELPPAEGAISPFVTWACTGSPCPWGASTNGYALKWETDSGALTARLGYTTSEAIYLPASAANGATIAITSGSASVYAGLPEQTSHRLLSTISAGGEYVVVGLAPNEVISVQSGEAFRSLVQEGEPPTDPEDPPPGPDPGPGPEPDPNLMYSVASHWHCNIAECSGDPWLGRVINWPSWAAYSSNIRAGDQSRTTYGADGAELFPYMGSWAHGCEVTAHFEQVLIIEWERGTDVWRETYIDPGETHVIQLLSPEDGAMIETNDYYGEFAVSLNNCTPQPLP